LAQSLHIRERPPRHYELTISVHGRNRIACRECRDLLYPAVEEKIITDEQRSGWCLHQAREGGVDFAVSARFQYLNPHPHDRSRRPHVSRCQLRYRIVWILKKADRRSAGHQLVQQCESLGPEFADERVDARQVAARPIETGNKAELDGVSADAEHDWDAAGRSLSRESTRNSDCDDHTHLKLDQISNQRR